LKTTYSPGAIHSCNPTTTHLLHNTEKCVPLRCPVASLGHFHHRRLQKPLPRLAKLTLAAYSYSLPSHLINTIHTTWLRRPRSRPSSWSLLATVVPAR
jgi:hypothetical protein